MDDPRVLRIITVGLILAAVVVVYLLLSGRLPVSRTTRVNPTQTTAGRIQSPTPNATVSATMTPSRLGQAPTATTSPRSGTTGTPTPRAIATNGTAQTLPPTAFPVVLAVVFSVSAVVSGYSLRKFPK